MPLTLTSSQLTREGAGSDHKRGSPSGNILPEIVPLQLDRGHNGYGAGHLAAQIAAPS